MPDNFNGPPRPMPPKRFVDLQDKLLLKLAEENVLDPLTGLYNTKYFKHQLEILGQSADINGLTIIMFDADDFRELNNKLGHLGADEVLKDIANTLKQNIRSIDIAAHYGGDEFLIAFPNLTDTDDIQSVILRIHQALNDHSLQVSFGFATDIKSDSEQSFDFLSTLKRADAHLFKMKQFKKV
jgi:diguanylate cyclase (GGDEF)-like protein